MSDPNVIFIYDHFYPDFTAGGPITSLGNLSTLIADKISVRILASAYQYQNHELIPDVEKDKWTTWNSLPVWYATDRQSIGKALAGLKPETTTLYLNGIFSIDYFLNPLRIASKSGYRVIISPRGMLQLGALYRGHLKKTMFINFLKLSGLLKNAQWHATDEQEATDIRAIIKTKNLISSIPNVPVIRNTNQQVISKQPGELRLVYYSLISEKKNLLFLISLLSNEVLKGISLDIIGPVKDKDYWAQCLELINTLDLNNRVAYKGEISPEKSLPILSSFHALVLPTKGENFGHAIVEMLSSSRPVLISNKTPWNDIEENSAGFAIPLEEGKWQSTLVRMIGWNNADFTKACKSAFEYYQHKFDFEELKKNYLRLFDTVPPDNKK